MSQLSQHLNTLVKLPCRKTTCKDSMAWLHWPTVYLPSTQDRGSEEALCTDLSIQSLELDFDLMSLGVGPVCKNTDDGLLISACVCVCVCACVCVCVCMCVCVCVC